MAGSADGGEGKKKKLHWGWKILILVLIVGVLSFAWPVGMLIIALGTVYPGWYMLFWTGGLLALAVLSAALLFRRKKTALGSAAALGACVLVIAGTAAYRYLSVTRHRQIADRINWYQYRPFKPDSRAVKVAADPAYRLAGTLPRIGAAYALYPVASGMAQSLYPPGDYRDDVLGANGSDFLYDELLEGKLDLIFALPPSKQQRKAAKKRGLEYEITPFAREAFVFFVNVRNPVTGLSCEQIRGIYSGRIARWEETGSGSGKIRPFQRNRGSGSQTMLERIMGNVPLMPPLREDRQSGMGGIINDVADYRNYPGALGFSFRFFASEMFRNDDIKLLTLDGVAPTRENIRSGKYPFVTDACIVTVRPRSENVRKIVDFLHSPAGRELIEKSGYTAYSVPAEKRDR